VLHISRNTQYLRHFKNIFVRAFNVCFANTATYLTFLNRIKEGQFKINSQRCCTTKSLTLRFAAAVRRHYAPHGCQARHTSRVIRHTSHVTRQTHTWHGTDEHFAHFWFRLNAQNVSGARECVKHREVDVSDAEEILATASRSTGAQRYSHASHLTYERHGYLTHLLHISVSHIGGGGGCRGVPPPPTFPGALFTTT